MIRAAMLLPLLLPLMVECQTRALPLSADVGYPAKAGSTSYDSIGQAYLLRGTGQYGEQGREELQFAYRKIGGDFLLTADFRFASAASPNLRSTGWMVRASMREDAAHVAALQRGDGAMVLQRRLLQGAYIRDPEDRRFYPKKGMRTIQLERRGRRFTMRAALPGEPLQTVGEFDMEAMPDSVVAGIFFCAQNAGMADSVQVANVRIDRPVPDRYHPNPSVQRTLDRREPVMGSRLEILDVATGDRKVIRESAGRFEAPNWMPEGGRLLYNEAGGLYTLPVEGGQAARFNTGSVDRNNNDHGISFDGRWLAISSHRANAAGGGSTVYVLPLEGGEPRMVNDRTPSYWHGWSPDGKEVLVVGQRNGSAVYNLYKVDVRTGAETDLTGNREGHVDGPEYSPDGRHIYYNANPTGTMQIWRMQPDGKGKEQMTFDEYHNWFPHISPDGKWIAFVSFPTDIEPSAHPAYKPVMLRLMPAAGGAPRVIAHLYGGQGTMNVNSWAPDSRRLAFVSNSEPVGSNIQK